MGEENETERNESLSSRQERVAAALAGGMTCAEAARKCRVGGTTIWRWRKWKVFQDRVEELKKEITDQGVARLAKVMGSEALNALTAILTKGKSEVVKANAALGVLQIGIQATDAKEMRAQIQQLTDQIEGRNPPPSNSPPEETT